MNKQLVSGTEGYSADSQLLIRKYEGFEFLDAHKAIIHLLPSAPSSVLDIGSGTGRDAAYMAQLGHTVVAVEPTIEFREYARSEHSSHTIDWIDDSLPNLKVLSNRGDTFDIVFLHAVWMHLDKPQRALAMQTLKQLTHKGSRVSMTLRHGPSPLNRRIFEVSGEETIELAKTHGFAPLFHKVTQSTQAENIAAGVTWTRIIIQRE